jgi:hypothetical protein
MSIKFTQFLRPDGKQVPTEIDMPDEVEKMAHELILAGCRFEIEELSTGVIHMDCTMRGGEGPLALELCDNGPPVLEAVERLVRESHSLIFSGGQNG